MLSRTPLAFAKTVLMFLLAMLVGACVTMTTAPDPLKAGPREDAGTVIVSVTANTAQINGFDGLLVRRISEPGVNVVDLNALNLVAPGLSRDTSMFVGMLREGEYEFVEFVDAKSNRKLSLSAGNRDLLGRFKVIRGRPVDLGRLIMTPLNEKVVVGRSAKVTSNKPLLERFAPEYAALLKGETSEGWLAPRGAGDFVEAYALTRPVGLDNPVELEDGSVIGASRLGTVLVRSPSGSWSAVRSTGLESLLCATPASLPDARLVVVGEFNTMLRLAPDGSLLVPIDTGNLPPGNLLFIVGDEVHGWYVVQQRGTAVTFYHSLVLEKGDWRAIRQESVGPSFWHGADLLWFWRTNRGFSYAVSAGKIHHFDFASGEWRSFAAPNDHRLTETSPNPDGSIGILTSPGGGFGGVFAGVFLSEDQGASWREITPKFKIKASAPIRLRSGTLMTISRDSAFSGGAELHSTRDEGRTWATLGFYSPGDRPVALPSGRMLMIEPGSFGIFSIKTSPDEGMSWKKEYTNFDSALYQAQQRK